VCARMCVRMRER